MAFLAAHLREAVGLASDTLTLRAAREIADSGTPAGAYLSVINVAEERTLRNLPHTERQTAVTRRFEPPVHVNLDVLVAFNMVDFETSLTVLSRTIEAFQTRRFFDATTNPPGGTVPFPVGLDRIILEMRNLSLEELNNLWRMLGGAYLPSVVYRLRLIEVQGSAAAPTDRITTVDLTTRNTATAAP